jgi:formate dehydrogenase maturation protein FdhE
MGDRYSRVLPRVGIELFDEERPMKVAVVEPKTCPFCGAAAVKTRSKVIDESTYFRCDRCAEIWNPVRLRIEQSSGRIRRW